MVDTVRKCKCIVVDTVRKCKCIVVDMMTECKCMVVDSVREGGREGVGRWGVGWGGQNRTRRQTTRSCQVAFRRYSLTAD